MTPAQAPAFTPTASQAITMTRISTLILDDPGERNDASTPLTITGTGATYVKDRLGFLARPAPPGSAFRGAWTAPRWALVLAEISGGNTARRAAYVAAAARAEQDPAFRDALFASWLFGGRDGMRALVHARG